MLTGRYANFTYLRTRYNLWTGRVWARDDTCLGELSRESGSVEACLPLMLESDMPASGDKILDTENPAP